MTDEDALSRVLALAQESCDPPAYEGFVFAFNQILAARSRLEGDAARVAAKQRAVVGRRNAAVSAASSRGEARPARRQSRRAAAG